MIKSVIFDYGGVVSPGGRTFELPKKISDRTGIDLKSVEDTVRAEWTKLSTGTITEDDFWMSVKRHLNLSDISGGTSDLWNTWEKDMMPDPGMLELIADLKNRSFKVGLLSNVVGPTALDIEQHGGYDIFDFKILSCEVGYSKPASEIYHMALDQLDGIRSHETIYVDDQQRCLEPAIKLGMYTVLALNTEQIINDIEDIIAANA